MNSGAVAHNNQNLLRDLTEGKSHSKGYDAFPTTRTGSDSRTKVHFSEHGTYKYIVGDRQPISIRINKGLYQRFKPLSKRVYGSVCRAVEVYMVAFIETVESGVHFSHTDRPINIEKIVIARNLRPRRKLEIEGLQFCGHVDCDEVAVGSGVWRGRIELPLCEDHFAHAKNNPSDWKELRVFPSVSKGKGGVLNE